jgi:hypothetical protein
MKVSCHDVTYHLYIYSGDVFNPSPVPPIEFEVVASYPWDMSSMVQRAEWSHPILYAHYEHGCYRNDDLATYLGTYKESFRLIALPRNRGSIHVNRLVVNGLY